MAAAPAAAVPDNGQPTPLSDDAAAYTAATGVTTEQADLLLSLQEAAGGLDALLTEREPGSFAGLWIEHQPFRVIVLLTTPESTDIGAYLEGGPLEGWVEIRRAVYSLARLERDAAAILSTAGTRPFDLDIDVFENRIELRVASLADFEAFITERHIQIPETAVLSVVARQARPAANI